MWQVFVCIFLGPSRSIMSSIDRWKGHTLAAATKAGDHNLQEVTAEMFAYACVMVRHWKSEKYILIYFIDICDASWSTLDPFFDGIPT